MTQTISKSTKQRQGVRRFTDRMGTNKEFDRIPRQWKEVVEKTEAGYKKANGKPAIISRTRHIPA